MEVTVKQVVDRLKAKLNESDQESGTLRAMIFDIEWEAKLVESERKKKRTKKVSRKKR